MFGGLVRPKRPVLVKHVEPHIIDFPGVSPGECGHMGRLANSDYKVKLMQYEQRKAEFRDKKEKRMLAEMHLDKCTTEFMGKTNMQSFKKTIRARVEERLKEFDKTIDARRQQLQKLWLAEQKEQMQEVVSQAQSGAELRMQEMRERVAALKAQRERERLEFVAIKRYEQYIEKSDQLRPILWKREAIDVEKAQLQQIRENESRRENEREMDAMWHHAMMKQFQSKKEREEYDELKRAKAQKEINETLRRQVQAQEAMQEERRRIEAEDREEMAKLEEELRQEKIRALDEKRRNRDLMSADLVQQIETHHKLLAEQEREERIAVETYDQLGKDALAREIAGQLDTKSIARREMQQYLDYVRQLEFEREEEERRLDVLLDEERAAIERKQDVSRKIMCENSKKLSQETLEQRANQIQVRRQIAEEEKKLKEADAQLAKMAEEQNERLEAEYRRQKIMDKFRYRDDLMKQMQYKNILQERERLEEERRFQDSKTREEEFHHFTLQVAESKLGKTAVSHPFRKMVEKEFCHCPVEEPTPPAHIS